MLIIINFIIFSALIFYAIVFYIRAEKCIKIIKKQRNNNSDSLFKRTIMY